MKVASALEGLKMIKDGFNPPEVIFSFKFYFHFNITS